MCEYLSQSDLAAFSSNRSVIFNFGTIKTGSTSFHATIREHIPRACKWKPGNEKLHPADLFAFVRSPLHGSTSFHKTLAACDSLGDNPWYMLSKSLIPAFPNGRFVMTRYSAGCHRWVESVRGLFESTHAGSVLSAFHRCVFGSAAFNQSIYVERCIAHEQDVVHAIRSHGRQLIVIANEWTESQKVNILRKHLGIPATRYHHIRTPNSRRSIMTHQHWSDFNLAMFRDVTPETPIIK